MPSERPINFRPLVLLIPFKIALVLFLVSEKSRSIVDPLSSPFTDVSIGGIYPVSIFDLRSGWVNPRPCPFLNTAPDVIHYAKELRKLKYEPELTWREPTSICHYECSLHIKIDESLELRDVSLTAFVFLHPAGIATLIFWINLEKYRLTCKDLCRIAKFVSTPVDGISATLAWHEGDIQLLSMADFGSLIRRQFSSQKLDNLDKVEFVHPIVYIGDVPDCSNAEEIKENYRAYITVIANLWVEDFEFVKEIEIEKVLQTDFHPYTYGISCATSNCTIELHPRQQTEQRALIGKMDIHRHNFREQMLLAYIVELVVIQYFWLRTQNCELKEAYEKTGEMAQESLLFKLEMMWMLPAQLAKLAAIHNKATKIFNDFGGIYLKRQSTVGSAIDTYRREFGMENLERNIERQLASLSNYISTAHRMLLSTAGVFISIIAIVFTVFRIISFLIF